MITMTVQKETKRKQSNKNQFSGKKYEEGVLNFQVDKMDPMSKVVVTEHVLGVVTTQNYSLNTGL